MDIGLWVLVAVNMVLLPIAIFLTIRETYHQITTRRYKREDERFVQSLPLEEDDRRKILSALFRRYDFPLEMSEQKRIADLRIGDLFSKDERWAIDRLINLEQDKDKKTGINLNAKIQDWSKIPSVYAYVAVLGLTTWLKHSIKLTDQTKEQLLANNTTKAMPLLDLIRECSASDEPIEETARVGEESPLFRDANRSFDDLLDGVSGMSHLRVPYVEMVELMENPDSDEEIKEFSRLTIEEIRGLIEQKREQERTEKVEREKKFIEDVRHSIGLQSRTEKVI